MPNKKLTDELLNELLDAPNIDGYIKEHDFAAPSLSDYLKQLLQEKGLERSRVVRMADLNETFGYQIFTGARHPSRNKVLQIAFAMALSMKETNRALTAAGVSVLGGISHNAGQIFVAMWVLDTATLIYYLPVLAITGIASGTVIGLLAVMVIRRVSGMINRWD